jgi:oxygen-dependent protoporphyrinogen oxidase
MGSLASALAARLDLETNCRVDRVQRVGRRVEIGSSKGTWKAAQVVSAVPSPIAAKFLMDQDTFEAEVLATAYGPGINVSWMLDGKYEPPESLIDVYGLLVPRSERRGVAAVAFETVKCPDRAPKDQLVNFMLDDVASTHALLQSDAVVNQLIRNATATVLPGIHKRVSGTRVFRWPMAMPLSPVGRARAVANYRRHVERMRPQVVLAGDYLGAPTTDSALSSGKWAARMLGDVGREIGPVSF